MNDLNIDNNYQPSRSRKQGRLFIGGGVLYDDVYMTLPMTGEELVMSLVQSINEMKTELAELKTAAPAAPAAPVASDVAPPADLAKQVDSLKKQILIDKAEAPKYLQPLFEHMSSDQVAEYLASDAYSKRNKQVSQAPVTQAAESTAVAPTSTSAGTETPASEFVKDQERLKSRQFNQDEISALTAAFGL